MDERERQEILQLINEKKYLQLKTKLSEVRDIDIAEILNPLDPSTTLLVFRMLPKDLAVEVFAHFSSEQQREIIQGVSDLELDHILNELFFDDMIDMIEEMPANIVNKILANSKEEERKLINQFLKYPHDSAGSIMTIEYVELKKEMTIKDALQHIKETGISKETVYTCYVTGKNRVLAGILSLRKIVTSNEDALVGDLMEDDIIFVHTHDDQETVANVFIRYGFLALPVVDNENRLTGIITVDDIMDVMEQEATEDFQLMAAMSPSEEAYLNTNVLVQAKNRLAWLLILMLTGAITQRIMTGFEDVLANVAILSIFIPMIMDTGGNSGNQSSTLIIRGLATGEITTSDGLKILWKEFRISIIVGIILSTVNFLRLVFLSKIDFTIALVVSITLVATVIIAKIIGGGLPILAKKIKLDPAIMAGPLITTVVDTIALLVYFSIAVKLLGI